MAIPDAGTVADGVVETVTVSVAPIDVAVEVEVMVIDVTVRVGVFVETGVLPGTRST